MRKHPILTVLTASALMGVVGIAMAQSMDGEVSTLRGAGVEDSVELVDAFRLDEDSRYTRNFRLQPPLVPHEVDKYQVDMSANQCLDCHDWTNATERKAPIASVSHYLDRNGVQLDTVAGSRWFCSQCHVPQAETQALVDNVFVPSSSK